MKAGNEEALTLMATESGTDLAGYKSQLAATAMFYDAAEAVKFTTSSKLPEVMKSVSQFSFDHGLLGDGAPDAGFIGMAFPGDVMTGNKDNVKFRFDDSFMKMAAEGKL
jgi:NitT/TauT family transport system substrate-binding protein